MNWIIKSSKVKRIGTLILLLIQFCYQSCDNSRKRGLCLEYENHLIDNINQELISELINSETERIPSLVDSFFDQTIGFIASNEAASAAFENIDNLSDTMKVSIMMWHFQECKKGKHLPLDSLVYEISNYLSEEVDRQESINSCQKESHRRAEINFRTFEQGDTLLISYPITINSERKYGVYLGCPRKILPLDGDSLVIRTILVDKRTTRSQTPERSQQGLYFELIVDKTSDENVLVLMSRIKKGSSMVLDLIEYGRIISRFSSHR